MAMIEIVLTVCALAQPARCEDQHLQYESAGSLTQCAMGAPPYIAQWIGEHPKWSVAKWRCEIPGRQRDT
jgi:hypothetical protein